MRVTFRDVLEHKLDRVAVSDYVFCNWVKFSPEDGHVQVPLCHVEVNF